jgi:hypothetical protein
MKGDIDAWNLNDDLDPWNVNGDIDPRNVNGDFHTWNVNYLKNVKLPNQLNLRKWNYLVFVSIFV